MNKNGDGNGNRNGNGEGHRLEGPALIAAFVVLSVWLIFLVWMAFTVDAPDNQWARLITLLGSFEAVAFAAAGALFGTTVQRQRVEDAKQETTNAKQEAEANRQDAANGRALKASIEAKATRGAPHRGTKRLGVEGVSAAVDSSDLEDLVAIARKLFPD